MHHARSGSSAKLGAALEPSLDWCEFHDTTLSVSAKPTSDPLLQGGVAGAGHGSWSDAVGLLGSATAAAVAGGGRRRIWLVGLLCPARPAQVVRGSYPTAVARLVARLVPPPCAISATMVLVAMPSGRPIFPQQAIVSGVTHGLVYQVQGMRVQLSQPHRFRVCDSLHRCNPVVGIHVCTPDKHFKAKCLCQCPHFYAGAMMDAIQHVRHFQHCHQLAPKHEQPLRKFIRQEDAPAFQESAMQFQLGGLVGHASNVNVRSTGAVELLD